MSRTKRYIISLILMIIIFWQGCSFTENNSEKIQSDEKNVTEEKIVREELEIEVADNIQSTYGLMRVHFIDVGQGDCSFIELGNGQTMLIDAGNPENGEEIVEYIEELQYSDIDFVVATHPHEDHIGGMTEIIQNFDIDIFYMPWAASTSYTYENMLDTLSEKRVEVHKAELGRTILSSGPIEITVLSPEEDTEYSDLNDASAVVRLQYGETVFLFTGDAGEMIEEELCDFNIDSDVLKVGHHGSETSSSEAFIQKVSPAEKLKVVQGLMEQGDLRAAEIYETIGTYFGYSIAYYSMFYDIKHVLIMGRVTSGAGGTILLDKANEVLEKEFPELYKKIKLHIPDEKARRVGQSVAAASLPKIG